MPRPQQRETRRPNPHNGLARRRVHGVLVGVVVAGAVVIAGIGFAGSYTAVRDLAARKDFGSFALFLPVGVDAGIVVLLGLDLLLTWIRIPFPLLRHTAWLLTAATIAFNAAAATDSLGAGMHAVIPVLFIITVEAARHAIGRIADITADQHMEGVRITRWLLSPIPTFLLWRRMKLWELRSYEQVIRLEQERLVYQARLHSRYGRTWRHKAPIESLMPLRLARYGVPLADTAPAGLTAAGIEPALLPIAPKPEQTDHTNTFGPTPKHAPETSDASSTPTHASSAQPRAQTKANQPEGHAPAPRRDQPKDRAKGRVRVTDRYYLAWEDFLHQHGREPTATELSTHLAGQGLLGRNSQPIPASTLRRYLLGFRLYHTWTTLHRKSGNEPSLAALATEAHHRGITGRHNQPLTPDQLATYLPDFHRRHQLLNPTWNTTPHPHTPDLSTASPTTTHRQTTPT